MKRIMKLLVFSSAILLTIFTASLTVHHEANGKPASDMTQRERVQSYSYFYGLSHCINSNRLKSTIDSNGRPALFFRGDFTMPWGADNVVAVGFLVDQEDGRRKCGNMIQSALNLWGYSDYDQFLLDIGYTLNNDGTKYTLDAKGEVKKNNFRKAIRDRIYSGNAVSMSPFDRYYMILSTFTNPNVCNAKNIGLLSSQSESIRRQAESGDIARYAVVKVLDSNAKAQQFVYELPDRYEDVPIYYTEDGSHRTADAAVTGNCSPRSTDSAGNMANEITRLAEELDGKVRPELIDSTTWNTIEDGGQESAASACAVDGIGWLICPVFSLAANIVDAAYSWVSSYLAVQPLEVQNRNSPIYATWATMRNVANVAFVVAFLIIVYSQMTGAGISNYGMKRMLPRLIIAAILVNLSYWICAIAVDLSNILGAHTKALFESVPVNSRDGITGATTGGGAWTALAVFTLSAGAIGAAFTVAVAGSLMGPFLLSLLVPALLAALAAIVTVFLVLTLRQALIILLIVISPLAFVAYLLPNTEGLFKKWFALFRTLLLMYPIIAGIFGASALASAIIMNTSNDFTVQVMGALISILPLAITPVIMKTAGGMLNRFAGIVNSKEKGIIDRGKNMARKRRGAILTDAKANRINRTKGLLTSSGGVLGARESRRRRIAGTVMSLGATHGVTTAEQEKTANARIEAATRGLNVARITPTDGTDKDTAGAEKYTKRVSNGDEQLMGLSTAYALQAAQTEDRKDVKAAEVKLERTRVDDLFEILEKSTDTTERAAALNQIYSRGGDQHIQSALDYVGTSKDSSMGDIQRLTAENLMKRKPLAMGGADGSAYTSGTYTGGYEDKLLKKMTDGKLGEREWASMSADEMIRASVVMNKAAERGQIDQAQFDDVVKSIDGAMANPNIQLTPEQKGLLQQIRTTQASDKANADFFKPVSDLSSPSDATQLNVPHAAPQQQQTSQPQAAPQQPAPTQAPDPSGSYTDNENRRTPNTAPDDYHDRMSK